MRKTILLLILTCLSVLMTAQLVFSQNDEKSTIIGNAGDDELGVNIVADALGNTYVGGKQNNKGLIVKQDALHNTIWGKTLSFTTNPSNNVRINFLDIQGDTLFGCGNIGQAGINTSSFYFKMNAQTGALYWCKYDLISTSSLFCMRYSNGKFFLTGHVRLSGDFSGKVFAVSSQTGNMIWETPLLHYLLPNPSGNTNHSLILNASEVVNGKLFITGSTDNTIGVKAPILIGITETGTVFFEKYLTVPTPPGGGTFFKARGTKIHFDLNGDLVFGVDCDFTNGYADVFLIKCDVLGNVLFCKNYNIGDYASCSFMTLNETAASYTLFGTNLGSFDGSYVLKVDKNGNFEKCMGITKPNVYLGINSGIYGRDTGNSKFINGKHYFATTETTFSPLQQGDINQIILDEDLNTIEDCSEFFEMAVPTMDVVPSFQPLTVTYIPNVLLFQNGGILEDISFTPYCQNVSLDLVQTTVCQSTITANVAGFTGPTFYWSTGDTTSVNELSVNTTDTVFLRVLDTKCCELIDTIIPSIIPSSFTMSLPADTSICLQPGNSFTITTTFSGANAPVEYLWNNGTNGSSLAITTSGTYWVELSDSCLTLRDSIVITVNALPVIGNTANVTVCADDFPATLSPTVSSGASVLWDDGTPTIQRSVNGPGSYTIAATNSCGTTTAILVVSQTNLPDVSLPVSIDTCVQNGGSIVLTATLNNVNTVLWSNGSPGNQLTVSTSGIYVVYGSNVCGIDSASILVGINSLPVIGNTANIIVCEDDFPAILSPTVSSGASVLWDDGTPTIQRSVNGPGSYTISATNMCGTVNAAIVVSQTNLPDVQLISSIDTCLQVGGNCVLIPVFSDVTNVSWSGGSSGNQLTVSTSGNYTVFGSNVCGIDSASCSVTINHFPELDLPATLDTCFEIGVGFSYTAQGSVGTYQWSSGSQTATEWISHEGIYSCTLTNQCGSITDSMRVRRLTEVNLYFPEDSIRYCAHQLSVSLLHIETNYNLEVFSPSGGLIGTHLSESGWYTVHAFNACGEKWDSIYVNLQNEQFFYLPNSFTPNGDQHNDRFEFKGENIVIREIRIFNRWGEEVFSQAGNFTGWDGHFQGQVCPDGMYAVHVIYEDCFGIPTAFSGHVNLLR
ncbi:gliding motility-associated C-terminal domain-containing protein [Fluviicola taffensis]|uniref:T9SS type B sorting domain-containing protein n=1 Tax=Fluviicola taffensis TaxID=191579 RepID=UPI003137E565